MREIDPIRNPSEALLSSALNRLATGSPKSAPEVVSGNLVREFRQHHRLRRQKRMAIIGSIAACLVAVALLVVQKSAWNHGAQSPALQALQEALQAQPTEQPAQPEKAPETQNPHHVASTVSTATTSNGEAGYLTLAPYDFTVSAADLTIVRVELTGSDLRLLGAPVSEDFSDQRLLADVVVSGDGTPYALRIVR
ncbi:MAG TPA: hypothetical protein VE783_06025 [Candidatus Limnocylindrales bacterium]|jgi:hypothetical protein|nr:hypothetical protein [Candidatus Limnocylindrales bacterium]